MTDDTRNLRKVEKGFVLCGKIRKRERKEEKSVSEGIGGPEPSSQGKRDMGKELQRKEGTEV